MRHERHGVLTGARTDGDPDRAPLTFAHVAHELNSLLDGSLRSVRLALASIESTESEEVDASARLRAAVTAMTDMADLLERAMSASRIDSGDLAIGRTIGETVEHLAGMLRPLLDASHVDLVAHVQPEAAGLPGGAVGSLLMNGLRNAIEACADAPGGRRAVEVAIALSRDGATLVVAVTDDGPGLPPVLEPGMTTKEGGHGLGLDTCRAIVADLGGRFLLTSVPFSGGTLMQVAIPVERLGLDG